MQVRPVASLRWWFKSCPRLPKSTLSLMGGKVRPRSAMAAIRLE